MSSYKTFAQFYDRLTDNVDYTAGGEYITGFFNEYGNGGKKVLDLACGTGTMCSFLSDKGYDVVGVDLSDDMLTIADNKCGGKVKLFKKDITDFSFNEKFDYCICTLDSLNHLPDINAVKSAFNCVFNVLKGSGLFIFDVNTVYKHRQVLADNTFVFDYEDFFLSWDNEYVEDDIIRILIDIFVYNGKSYDRYSEEFSERAYAVDELIAGLEEFEIIKICDNLSQNLPNDESERIFFICRRN